GGGEGAARGAGGWRARPAPGGEGRLLPARDAFRAPPWVPWRERVRPGDLGAGDILPAPPDDERLVPAAVIEGDDGVEDMTGLASQLAGLAESAAGPSDAAEGPVCRARLLSALGRARA